MGRHPFEILTSGVPARMTSHESEPSDYSMPWRLWGLALSKAGETFRYTEQGFVIDVPPDLERFGNIQEKNTINLWGWDGATNGYIGGAPYATPSLVWEYFFRRFGLPSVNHPLYGLAKDSTANLEIGSTRHLLRLTQIHYKRVLLRKDKSDGSPVTLVVKLTSGGLTAETLIWRWVAFGLTFIEPTSVTFFALTIRSIEAMPPYFGVPEANGELPLNQALAQSLMAHYAPELCSQIPFTSTKLGPSSLLWQTQSLPDWPGVAWINRAICCRARIAWSAGVMPIQQWIIRFTKINGCERLFLCFGDTHPFHIPETEESNWAGQTSAFPQWGDHRGWWDGASWALELNGDMGWEDIKAFAENQGICLDSAKGEKSCWLIAYCHELNDTPMDFHKEGVTQFQMGWITCPMEENT